MADKPRLGSRTVRALIVLAVLGVGAAALALNMPSGKAGGPLGGQPLPELFPDSRLGLVESVASPEQARARRDATRWLATHPGRDDIAFAAFALNSVGRPPHDAAQRRELAVLHLIDARRTPAGVIAANWLEAHGKKDVWKLYLKQYGQLAGKPALKPAKLLFKATYKLANTLAGQGKARFARPSPYITDPSLHAINQKRFAAHRLRPTTTPSRSRSLRPRLRDQQYPRRQPRRRRAPLDRTVAAVAHDDDDDVVDRVRLGPHRAAAVDSRSMPTNQRRELRV